MRNVTDNFKIDLRTFGRQLDPKIKINDADFDTDNLNYIKPAFYTSLFKTIMHQVEIDSKVYMPNNTKVNIKIGVKVNEKNYEYVKLGTYYVKTCERQEDTNSYRIMAYTKIKESMIDYDLKIAEKISLRDYLIRICQRLGWNTENIPAIFINSTKLVDPTLHAGIDYTFRDALDEIATISCSFLLFKDDDFYLMYLTQVDANIDESYLDEDNITIGEKYFINSLVFSRAEESDNIYRKDDSNITLNGLHEYKISDCQLLSTNDRADYIDEMFEYLKTLEFYIFDIQSKGILFLESCDMFNLTLNGITYPTVLLNDEINIEDGLTESLYLDEPEETETEYKYADSTDKKINQTYLIVDKQNQKIEALISQQTEQSSKLTQVEQTVGSISQKVENIEDVTNTVEGTRVITLGNCVEGDLLELHIYGNNTVFDYLHLSDELVLSDDLILHGDSKIIVTDEKNNSTIYDPGINDVLRQNGDICDEFILENSRAQIIRRINTDGTIKETENIEDLGTFTIALKEGTNTITIKNYKARIMAKWVVKNEYTEIYATRVEMNSKIEQTAGQIKSEVDKKVDETEFGTMIEQNWEYIKYAWNQISQYLKMEGLEGKATLNIYDENNTLLMSLSQDGQTFYDSAGSKIGTVGIVREENQDTLAFAMNVDWDKVSESKSMAWGYFEKSGKFLPIFRLVGTYGGENSEYGGDLAVEGGLQVEALKVIKNTIESGDTSINICDANGNIIFSADSSTLFFNILNLISSYRDKSGSICFDFGDNRLVNMRNVAQTDENLNYIAGSADNHIFASFKDGGSVIIFASSSDRNLKKNIEDTTEKGLDKIMKIKHRKFDWKSDNSHQNIGYIAQEMQEIDDGFVHHTTHKLPNGEEKEDWQINALGVLATTTKAIQEQQILIKELQEKDKQKDELITNLISRIEKLEGKVNGI